MVDGALHAAELRRLDVQHLQHVVGQRVDEVGDAGQRLSGVALGLLQRSLLVCGLKEETSQSRQTEETGGTSRLSGATSRFDGSQHCTNMFVHLGERRPSEQTQTIKHADN